MVKAGEHETMVPSASGSINLNAFVRVEFVVTGTGSTDSQVRSLARVVKI